MPENPDSVGMADLLIADIERCLGQLGKRSMGLDRDEAGGFAHDGRRGSVTTPPAPR
ncbi:hypothetical protein ACWDYH_16110 [Nocardia goodfellowii]